jgi:hypothetical protein
METFEHCCLMRRLGLRQVELQQSLRAEARGGCEEALVRTESTLLYSLSYNSSYNSLFK